MSKSLRMVMLDQPENDTNNSSNLRMQVIPSMPEESFGEASVMAPFRISGDILSSGYKAIENAPENYEYIKNELPNVPSAITEHPLSSLKQFGGGLAEAGGSVLALPDAIQNYLSDRLHLLNKSKPIDYSQGVGGRIGETLQALNPHKELPSGNDELQKNIADAIQSKIGQPEYPGQSLLRSAGRNALNIVAGSKLISALNPMKLTSKNIANNIVDAEKQMINKYSGENGLYAQNADKAKLRGITGKQINPDANDLDILKEHMPEDEYAAIDKLMNDKNLPNAQNAISQLGYRERVLKRKSNRDILNENEKKLYKSVQNVKNNIKENMFKDQHGEVHKDLVNEHNDIQKGYAREVIPYTKNVPLQEYKAGDRLASSLVNKISNENSKFAARRGKEHPALGVRRFVKQHPYLTFTGGVAPIYLAKQLYNYMNNNDYRNY